MKPVISDKVQKFKQKKSQVREIMDLANTLQNLRKLGLML